VKDKKQPALHNTIGSIKFVASVPIDNMSTLIADLPDMKSRVLLHLNHRTDYRVRSRDGQFGKPIFLSMSQWNQDETLVVLSYYFPSRLKIIVFIIVVALLLMSGFIYIISGSPTVFLVVWAVFLFGALYNRANGIGTFEGYKFDETKRQQDDIMDYIINQFKQKVELNIIS